jgi:hypothetical protein
MPTKLILSVTYQTRLIYYVPIIAHFHPHLVSNCKYFSKYFPDLPVNRIRLVRIDIQRRRPVRACTPAAPSGEGGCLFDVYGIQLNHIAVEIPFWFLGLPGCCQTQSLTFRSIFARQYCIQTHSGEAPPPQQVFGYAEHRLDACCP